jgi:hypothetical protein
MTTCTGSNHRTYEWPEPGQTAHCSICGASVIARQDGTPRKHAPRKTKPQDVQWLIHRQNMFR